MTLDQLARHHPRVFDWGIRLDRAPAAAWLALQAAALAPTWLWMARRLQDGADDPLGLLALCALALLAWSKRRSLRAAPRLGWLAL
ncbi:MAG TPA: exosortase Q, partial [Variovorax sp.]|nr:exosortase Q [Variovorax sp.]